MTDYTPTDNDIRDGFSLNYARDYEHLSARYYEACRFGEQVFSRWLEEHDRQVAEKAWDEGRSYGMYDARATNYVAFSDRPNPNRKDES